MRARTTLVGCLAWLGAVALSVPAEAANQIQLRLAKHEEGPYLARSPLINVSDSPKSAYFRLKNKTNHTQDVLAADDSFGSLANYEIRWYRGNQEITDEMQGIGSAFRLRPDRPKLLRARIKAPVADPGGFCLNADFLVAPGAHELSGGFYINDQGACG